MQRLLKKFDTAADAGAAAGGARGGQDARAWACIYFGSTARRWTRRWRRWPQADIHLDAMRLRAFPFPASVAEFIAAHDQVFVVEQNRDAQMRTLLINELEHRPGAR